MLLTIKFLIQPPQNIQLSVTESCTVASRCCKLLRQIGQQLRIWSRRTVSLEDPGELCFGDLSYRPSVRQLSGPAGKEVLPKRLAQLIELLLRNAEVPITRNVIFNRIWGPDAEVTDAVIDTYIHLTRQRLAHLQSAVKIQNSRGTGYQLSYEREL